MATQPGTKTFKGRNIQEAIDRAKKEYGPNAVVVEKREVKKSLFTLKADPMVEIVAAPADFLPAKPAAAPAKNAGTLVERTYGQATIPAGGLETPPGVSVDITHGRAPAPAAAPAPAQGQAPGGAPSTEALAALVQAVVHNEVNRLTSDFACGSVPQVGARFMETYRQMLDNGVDAAIAKDLAINLQYELNNDHDLNDETVNDTLRTMLAREFKVEPPTPEGQRQPLVVALVGPSGSGKTTTIVKLAFAAFSRQKNVGLITEDVKRPGAEQQLRALTQLMNLPLLTADSPARIAEEIRNLQGMDLILIDTGGRSHRDVAGMAALRDNLAAAAPHETHLVLPATLAERAALATADAYRACGYNRLLVSKLDEATTYGLLVNLARKLPEPLTYLAMGETFRNGFVAATPEILARLALGDDSLVSGV